MYLIFNKRIVNKSKLAAFASFICGLVFLIGLFIQILVRPTFVNFFEQMIKITCQSNLISFIIVCIYLWNHTHRIFDTNTALVLSAAFLSFAALGFWCILFPVYYVDLGSFLIPPQVNEWKSFNIFYSIWDHTITQIFYIIFFFHCIKRGTPHYLRPASQRIFMSSVYFYFCGWTICNVLITLFSDVFPTYGILTNFNYYTNFKSDDKTTNLFGVRILLFSHFFSFLIIWALVVVFSSVSHKFRNTKTVYPESVWESGGSIFDNSDLSALGVGTKRFRELKKKREESKKEE